LALLFTTGGPVRAEQKLLTASEAECGRALKSCINKCPVNPKLEHDKCVNRCNLQALMCE
jgi:hypothetical protein